MPVASPALKALSMSDPVRVGIIDHGSGNLHSARRALRQVGAEVIVSNDPSALLDTDALVLPGVGALAACMTGLRAMGGARLVRQWVDEGRPLLGICVGHQMLFERGRERDVDVKCLGVLPGVVEELPAERLPHTRVEHGDTGRRLSLISGRAREVLLRPFLWCGRYRTSRPLHHCDPSGSHLCRSRRVWSGDVHAVPS